MTDKLRALAERFNTRADIAAEAGDKIRAVTARECSLELAACLPSEAGEGVAVLDVGFKYENGIHTPTVLVGFKPDDWASRDRFAATLTATPPAAEVDGEELADWRAMFVALMEQGLDKLDPTFKPTPLWPNSWHQDVAFVAQALHEAGNAIPNTESSEESDRRFERAWLSATDHFVISKAAARCIWTAALRPFTEEGKS